MSVLSVSDVSLAFGGLQALADVSLDVHENEIVGLIGPNGAGKTTLFNCITGFETPDAGTITIHGQRVTGLRPDERTRLGLGRTFQHVGLVRSFTVLENLLVAQHRGIRYHVGSGLFGAPSAFAEEEVIEDQALHVLDHLGLAHLADTPLSGLSYGTLKQVEVAAALATDPTILMLDEPLAGLGPRETAEFGDRLLAMRHELDLTIVVIEHHVPFVLRVCDYVHVLNFGRILAKGEPDEIRGNPIVAEAYLGDSAAALA
jgi:branched-chain amino acid transport system ATP-binding protein